ncbi:DUF6712 family protein [Chondrinema litorale]|uniref:DUF6712 family protein n=1 Tax=Chondrinema litorale TaxID=2994555 RepID=UPI002543DE9A|nr:DUF6712 family protein [Chondrinema litorale]UZR93138.1 hypothetical protein OQ292_14860 [Chondrinema litorale]
MLIKDKEMLQEYLEVNGDLKFDSIKKDLKKADQLLLLDPLFGIGDEFYAELDAIETPEGKEVKLLELLRQSVADYAYSLWARMHAVQNSNSGIAVVRTDRTAPVSDAKLEGIIADKLKSSHQFMELALKYLEKNADDFEAWKNSSAYTIRKELFISSVDEFDRFCYIERSRIIFMKLRHLILQGEDELIKPELGDDLYNVIKAEYQADNLKAVHLPVVEKIQRTLANYALGKHKKDEDLQATAETHQKALIDFLRKNQTDYPILPINNTQGRGEFPNRPESSQFIF